MTVLVLDDALVSVEASWTVLAGTLVTPPVTELADEDAVGRVVVDVELAAEVAPTVVVSRKERVVKRLSMEPYVARKSRSLQCREAKMPVLTCTGR